MNLFKRYFSHGGFLTILLLSIFTHLAFATHKPGVMNSCTYSFNINSGDTSKYPKRKFHGTRLEAPPEIDGKLTDSCWMKSEVQTDYTQFTPVYRGKPSARTELRILYDDKNVYVGIRAYDDTTAISKRLGRRDNFDGDIVGVHFDSYFDHRSAFEFDITAAGQKLDVWVGNDGWDVNWNAVWYGKVAYEDSAWTAEMQIPLSQLRYSSAEEQVWGLNSWRLISRLHEEDHWNLVANDGTGLVYTFGELHGLKGLKKARRIELVPYVSGKYETSKRISGNPFAKGHDFKGLAGLDAKIGITNNFTLDATINPDFGQVEADPSVMNLTAFETYFEEKRPFFLEGKNIFDFTFDSDQLFYTRRLGHAPSYTPNYPTISMPENTTIGGAFKLSGKTSKGLSVGIIESVTTEEMVDIYDNQKQFRQVAEPLTNYFIGRFQKDFHQGNTIIGGILTHSHRMINKDYLNFLSRNALTYGLDFTRYWNDRKYFVEVKTIGSSIDGNNAAIARLQNSSARYYQRPDVHYISLDSTRTALNGLGASVKIGKWSKGHWRYSEEINMRTPGLELNDLGYMTISDIAKNNTNLSYFEKENQGIFKTYSLTLVQQNAWNNNGDGLFSSVSLAAESEFINSWNASLSTKYKFRTVDEWILRGGPGMKVPDLFQLTSFLMTNSSRKLYFSINGDYSKRMDGNSHSFSITPQINYRPVSNLLFSLQPSYQKNVDELQYLYQFKGTGDSRSYLLGKINNQNLGITFRVDLAITPELTVQYYGSPFVSMGEYSEFKRIVNPRADEYSQRFNMMEPFRMHGLLYFDENNDGADYQISNPDFNFHQFRSNLVLRWEFRAGSSLYLVWAQDRTDYEPGNALSFEDGFDRMQSVYPNNIFMVKFNYWLAY